jgi:preprotein translocase subunit SecF
MKLFKDEPNIKFMSKRWYAFGLSLLIIAVGIVLMFTRGFNWGIDFSGGTMVEISFKDAMTVGQLRAKLSPVGLGKAEIQRIGGSGKFFIKTETLTAGVGDAATEDHMLIAKQIRSVVLTPAEKAEEAAKKLDLNNSSVGDIKNFLMTRGFSEEDGSDTGKRIIDARKTSTGVLKDWAEVEASGIKKRVLSELQNSAYLPAFTFLSVEVVGPQVGADLKNKAILATFWSLLAMLVYIAVRFKFLYGMSAVLTLAHDVLVTLAFILIFNIEFNLTTLAAILTLVGFSINDTIVIFDRLRDNLKTAKRENFAAILDKSINQTLSRTVITSGTVFLTVLSLLLFGGEVLYSFAFAMFVGVISGSYSTIYQSCAWLLIWERWIFKKRA